MLTVEAFQSTTSPFHYNCGGIVVLLMMEEQSWFLTKVQHCEDMFYCSVCWSGLVEKLNASTISNEQWRFFFKLFLSAGLLCVQCACRGDPGPTWLSLIVLLSSMFLEGNL